MDQTPSTPKPYTIKSLENIDYQGNGVWINCGGRHILLAMLDSASSQYGMELADRIAKFISSGGLAKRRYIRRQQDGKPNTSESSTPPVTG